MTRPATAAPRRGRAVVGALSVIALLCAGVLIGRSTTGTRTVEATVTRTVTAPAVPAAGETPLPPVYARTPEGAAEATAASLSAFDAETLFDPTRLQATIDRVVATGSRTQVAAVYATAVADLRRRFGLDGQPKPLVVVRAAPVGFHVVAFSADRASVDVWDVGVLGSGAGPDPSASWRTDRVELVWEDGTWKASGFASSAGPTPALAAPGGVTPPGDFFSTAPAFTAYAHVAP